VCLFFVLLLAGPRIGIVFWWLINPDRWDNAFDSFIWPLLVSSSYHGQRSCSLQWRHLAALPAGTGSGSRSHSS
jgi:hypothetical protein